MQAAGIYDVQADGVEFKWEIRQFSKVKIYMESVSAKGKSSAIFSNAFGAKLSTDKNNQHNFHLRFQKFGGDTYELECSRINDDSDYILPLDSINVELFFLNNEQKKKKLRKNGPYCYIYSLSSDILKDEKLLINDTLTIICNLVVEYDESTIRPYLPLEDVSEILLENIKNLLTSEQYSDVTLMVNDTEFKVHKIILAALSPVFEAMFSHKDIQESLTHQVFIKDTNTETMKKFLEFIYSGKIEVFDEEKFDLWILADKYQIETLKNYCEEFISCNINEQCVLQILKFADSHNIKNLLDKTLNYFVTHCKNKIMYGEGKDLAEKDPRSFDLIVNSLDIKSNPEGA